VDPALIQDLDFLALHEQFRTKIDLGIESIEAAIAQKLRFSVLLGDG
jgi:hypothetical protein